MWNIFLSFFEKIHFIHFLEKSSFAIKNNRLGIFFFILFKFFSLFSCHKLWKSYKKEMWLCEFISFICWYIFLLFLLYNGNRNLAYTIRGFLRFPILTYFSCILNINISKKGNEKLFCGSSYTFFVEDFLFYRLLGI